MRSYYNIVGMWLLVVDEKTKLRVLWVGDNIIRNPREVESV